MTKSSYQKIAALALLAALAFTPVAAVQPAMAYDDDVEFVCGENDLGEDYCVSVEDLKAECPLSDPDGVGEECAGLEKSRPGRGARHLALIEANLSHENDDQDNSSSRR